MTEARMWEKIREALRGKTACHAQRIENACDDGAFDVELRCGPKQLWLELKQGDAPVDPDSMLQIKIRLSQIHWYARRHAAGGGAAFLLWVGGHLYVVTSPSLVVALHRRQASHRRLINEADREFSDYDYWSAIEWCLDNLA